MDKVVKDWFDHGLKDFDTAEKLRGLDKYNDSAFYCQQASEKALKALLINKTNSFPKIHDLTRLARLADAPKNIIKLCSILNPAYIATRYPDSPKDYTKEECDKLLVFCKEVLEWIKKSLL